MKTHSRTPQGSSQKSDSTLLTKFLVILGIFGVTTFVTYGAVSTPESAFMSTPYMTRSSTGDLVLSGATNGQGAAILNAYVAKILSGATAQGGGVPAYNAYLKERLAALDALDNSLQAEKDANGKPIYGTDYTFIFSYIYPRLYEQLKLDQTTSVIGRIGSALGLGGATDEVIVLPIPAAPAVTANDITNTVNGWNAATMEASLSSDGGNSYGAFTGATQDLTGNKMLKVRLKATNTALSSLITVLTFTTNSQQSAGFTFSASFSPATIASTGSSVLTYSSNVTGGVCNYNRQGSTYGDSANGSGSSAGGSVPVNVSQLGIPTGATGSTVRTYNFACYNANSTLAGTGSASITVLPPPVVVAATPAPTVSIVHNGNTISSGAVLTATATGTVQLTWSSTNSTSCLIDGPDGKFNGLASTSGTNTFAGFTTDVKSKYEYRCYGPGVQAATAITFYVQGVAPVVVDPYANYNNLKLGSGACILTDSPEVIITSAGYEWDWIGTDSIKQVLGIDYTYSACLRKCDDNYTSGTMYCHYEGRKGKTYLGIQDKTAGGAVNINNVTKPTLQNPSLGISGLVNGSVGVNDNFTITVGTQGLNIDGYKLADGGVILMDGTSQKIYPVTPTTVTATPAAFGLAVGPHSLSIKGCRAGKCNSATVNTITFTVTPVAPAITANNTTVGSLENVTLTVQMDPSKIDYYNIVIDGGILKDAATGSGVKYTATTATATPIAFGFTYGHREIQTIGCKNNVCGTLSDKLKLTVIPQFTQDDVNTYVQDRIDNANANPIRKPDGSVDIDLTNNSAYQNIAAKAKELFAITYDGDVKLDHERLFLQIAIKLSGKTIPDPDQISNVRNYINSYINSH